MKKKIFIKRWGNSAGISLSKAMRQHLRADIGDKVTVEMVSNGLLIRSTQKPKYTLEKLLASCTSESTNLSIDDIAWLRRAPVGKEL